MAKVTKKQQIAFQLEQLSKTIIASKMDSDIKDNIFNNIDNISKILDIKDSFGNFFIQVIHGSISKELAQKIIDNKIISYEMLLQEKHTTGKEWQATSLNEIRDVYFKNFSEIHIGCGSFEAFSVKQILSDGTVETLLCNHELNLNVFGGNLFAKEINIIMNQLKGIINCR